MITAEHSSPQLHVVDHEVVVPLDWDAPGPERLTVFARELVAPERRGDDLPLLLFLQGGPGSGSPRPLDGSGWIGALLERFRVVLLDQRGTGRSSRVDAARIAALPSGAAGADLLARFRADSIVRDAEHLRRTDFGGRRWATLGQSFGGFVTWAYLSRAPEALTGCLVTGGIPSLHASAAEVYRRTFPKAVDKHAAFAARYPDDVLALGRLADRLAAEDVRLPDGDRLTVRRLQFLGSGLGMQHGFEQLHWLLDESVASDGGIADGFLAAVQTRTSFAENPLWAVLQEACYGDAATGATAWAAQAERDRRPAFAEGARPLLLTGEAMFPWMFEEVRLLRPFAAAAEALARREDWPALTDPARLAANEVPVVAAVYADDLYVPADLSLETAAVTGSTTTWVTDEWEHDGLRSSGGRVVRHLLGLLDERGGLLR